MGTKEENVVLNFKQTGQVEFAQNAKQLNKIMNEAAQKYRMQTNAMGTDATATDRLKATKEKLTRQIEAGTKRTEKLRQEYEKSVKETGAYSDKSLKLHGQLAKSDSAEKVLKDSLAKTNQELKKQAIYSDELKEKLNKMTEVGNKMKSVGKTMSMYVTAPIVAGVGLSIKAASDFESSFAGVKKTVDEVVDKNGKVTLSYKDLEDGIRKMALEIPAATTEINAVAESAGQLGIKTENVLSFTRTMIDMGQATNMSSEDAATALAKLANITQMPQENFDKLGSSIVNLGNNMATTESDIVEMSLRLAGSSKQAGMSEDQILALAAAMSSVGINAEAGGGSMSRIMQKINSDVMSGAGNLENFASVANMSASDFQKAWKEDASSALVSFVEGLDSAGKSGEDVSGILKDMGIRSTQEVDTMLRLAGAGDVLSGALDTSAEGWRENTALTKEAETRYATFESKLQMVKNKFSDIMITVGGPFMDAVAGMLDGLTPILNVISSIATKFGEADKNTQQMIMTFVGIVAAIGPTLIILGQLVTSVSAIVRVVKSLQVALALMSFNPVVLGIGLLIAAFVLCYTKIGWFRDGVNMYMKGVKDIFVTILKFISGFFKSSFGGILTTVSDVFSAMKRYFNGIIDFVAGVFTGDWSRAWEGLVNIFGGIMDGLSAVFKAPLNAVIGMINGFIGGLNHIKIPDWVPKFGGNSFSISPIPYLAKGGHFLNGQAIVGEAGPELVSSTNGRTTVTPLSNDEKSKGIGGNLKGTTVEQHVHINSINTGSMNELDRMNRGIAKAARLNNFGVGRTNA
ncbi:phage tail tape measure protein [Brochothrix campestris]|uniref:Tail tape measure protein n=1 Tax=Brochothrix campestris FSL F6-1037 TaxID=1265861 RepID=W7CZ00_9LIST|nr:phage tail tape measure protein [Brochothrix campestris]EUJ41980.1 tail tape measure protein [Brochothrix campestris FSL F6-1037]